MTNFVYQLPENPYCVFLGNAKYPPGDLCTAILKTAASIICIDGGANYARKHQITPNIIIGDLDSIHKTTLAYFTSRNIDIKLFSSQQENDLEKGFEYTIRTHNFHNIIMLGCMGERDDQSFATLQIAKKFSRDKTVYVYSQKTGYLFLSPGSYQFIFTQNHPVSLFGLPTAVRVRTRGFQWNLNDEDLTEGSRGVSNIALTAHTSVSFEKGQLLLISPIQPS
jgi:thiamine pyrophosphokinase